MRLPLSFYPFSRALALSCVFAAAMVPVTQGQQAPQKPAEKTAAKDSAPTEPQNPAQIELLETKVRFEANGDSRKEVHTRVHINSELGVRQFARLNFDYNRAFESIDIPLVRITHSSGGTADILPSAITDNPNPAVVNAPAYQDVRVKSVRILGLAPGDLLEYRIITTTTHHPLAPDFWLDHSFDRSGVVTQEIFELDLPASLFQKNEPPNDPLDPLHLGPPDALKRPPVTNLHISPSTPPTSADSTGIGDSARTLVHWDYSGLPSPTSSRTDPSVPDVALSTLRSAEEFSERVAALIVLSKEEPSLAIEKKIVELTRRAKSPVDKVMAIYDFVSRNITNVDLPLGATGFTTRSAEEVLSSGYATPEDKFVLFDALSKAALHNGASLEFICSQTRMPTRDVLPSSFQHALVTFSIGSSKGRRVWWLDPSLEVAPMGMIPANLRGKPSLWITTLKSNGYDVFVLKWPGVVPYELPFPASQNVKVDASLGADGALNAKVHYSLRGDNELLLRVAFHQAPQEKWKDLAQLLSISDGFRGQVTSVTASDPYATREPFTLDYEITQPKFVDWSKKTVHIPALLPQLGLPDPPVKYKASTASSPIELGTPLEVETHMTLHLPPGTVTQTPTGTSVVRDYATYASQYSAKGPTITASRHINFLLREVPADRAADYNAFLHAVQSDEAQDFTLDRPDGASGKTVPQGEKPATPKPRP